ncbi:gpi-anchored cell wall organization protein ecm33 [Colletotrichum truncatum]|uniref:Gpi-anchored cell wall organization protein ecm33 n=1 Tax=Colletotrichum truncatum TaxID=5467 RepID=A0ACC3YEE0_COLTU|nr:gpi-anchored cell wall organization protein ecm33 [Colletotrichum truncatum]KAF6790130.1 gpi-anchored cell wall organization protein ecm33 [Colletotrichum truncatum]
MRYQNWLIAATYLVAIDVGWANNCSIPEDGYFVIDSQAKANELSNCKTYFGRVHIDTARSEFDPNLSITLQGVEKIDGTLVVADISSFSAPDLREVNGFLYIRGKMNPAAALNLSLPALETVSSDVQIYTRATESLSFPSLIRIGGLEVDHAYRLRRLSWGPTGFPIIMNRDGKVLIQESGIESVDWLFSNKRASLGSVEIKSSGVSNITIVCKSIDNLSIAGVDINVTFDMFSAAYPGSNIGKLSLSGMRQINYVAAPDTVADLIVTESSFTQLHIPFSVTNSLTISNNRELTNLYYIGNEGSYWDTFGTPQTRSITLENNPALSYNFFTNMGETNTSTGAWRWPQAAMDTLVFKGSNFSSYFFSGLLQSKWPVMRFEVSSDNSDFSCEDMDKLRKNKDDGKFPGQYRCQRRDPRYGSAVHLELSRWNIYGVASAVVALTAML